MNTPIHLEYEDAVLGLKRAIELRGEDHRNATGELEGCVYFDVETRRPSCIIGHLLADMGVTAEQMLVPSPVASQNGTMINERSVMSLCNEDIGMIDCDRKTQVLLESAQDVQDGGETWGDALAAGLDAAGRIE